MNEKPTKKSPYECRKHFEAALHGLAVAFGSKHQHLRQSLKWFLIRKSVIRKSTKELTPKDLDCLGEAIGIYTHRWSNRPPEERGNIDFEEVMRLFFDEVKSRKN